MSPDLQLQLAQLLNAGATIVALVLGHQANRRSKQNRSDIQESEPVTITGMIRVLRYMEHLANKTKGRHEHPEDPKQRGGA